MNQSLKRKNPFQPLISPFKKLICNLLLGVHPICINKWSHPLCTKFIHQFYLNYYTICLEYERLIKLKDIKNINDTMIYSAEYGNIILVKWCFKNMADIHYKTDYAFRYAVRNDYFGIVKFLIDKGADVHVNYDNDDNDDVLYWAIGNGNSELVKIFLNKGLNVNYSNIGNLLWISVFNGNLEIIKLLLNIDIIIPPYDWRSFTNGVDHNSSPYNNAWQQAVKNGNLEIIKLLINNKYSNINNLDTRIICHTIHNYPEIARLLIIYKLDVKRHIKCSSYDCIYSK